jgi:hypothetical protein
MDSLFLFLRSRIFRHFSGLQFDTRFKNTIGFIYPFGICNNQFNFKSLDYLNIHATTAIQELHIGKTRRITCNLIVKPLFNSVKPLLVIQKVTHKLKALKLLFFVVIFI